jgi:hypothetical protein
VLPADAVKRFVIWRAKILHAGSHAFLSSRTRTTVPSRINRMIGSAESERAFQASKSLLTLRQTRLTTSLPIPPAKRVASARLTRRVLVPDR